ncbi:MAG: Gfo/Idh/MocA family oxidoreductase [Chloroflexi bacterium]|nr:Gfo/Idh/MocA family oxidoreductase [Chloroflexota bacterium]
MTMDTIRVGLIGAGGNTRLHHAPKLQAIEGVEVVAVANRSMASSQRFADEFGIPNPVENWIDIIDDDEIDAVCIGTWPYMHSVLTIAALESDKHVMVEARMAANSAEAHAMFNVSKERPDLIAQIVPAPHTLGVDRQIIDMISEGYVGDIVSVDARIGTGKFPDWEQEMHWRDSRDYSGNNIMSMGIWSEAMMRWLGDYSSVMASGQNVIKYRLDSEGRRRSTGNIPDQIDIIAGLEAGGQAHIQVSNISGFGPMADVWIHGTEGTLRLVSEGGQLNLSAGQRGDAQMSPVSIPAEKVGAWRVEEEFINAIRGIEPITHTDFTTGVKYMEFTDAVTHSMQIGATIDLPLSQS